MRWGISFEAYLEGLTLGRVQAEFVVISPLVKFIKNHLHPTWLRKRVIFCKCQVIHILTALYLITEILSCIINDNLETNGAELRALGKSFTENFVLRDCLIVTNALGSVADKGMIEWMNFSMRKLRSIISNAFEKSVRTTIPMLLILSAPWWSEWRRLTR